jgi:Flp pilus assembly pilin Flp
MIQKFLADERGATAIEYSVIAGMMLIVVVGIASAGGSLSTLYERVGLIAEALDESGHALPPTAEAGEIKPPA